jgi:hypothetical protein
LTRVQTQFESAQSLEYSLACRFCFRQSSFLIYQEGKKKPKALSERYLDDDECLDCAGQLLGGDLTRLNGSRVRSEIECRTTAKTVFTFKPFK